MPSTDLNLAAGLDAANTAYRSAADQFLNFDQAPGDYIHLTKVIPSSTKKIDLNWLSKLPVSRRWVGERVLQFARQFNYTVEMQKREATWPVERTDLAYDNIGVVTEGITEFVRAVPQEMYDSEVFDKLNTNPVGYDGVSLFSTAHPFGPPGSATQPNWTQAAFTRNQLVTAIKEMSGIRLENGQNPRLRATKILFADDMQDVVMDAISDLRVQGITAAGVTDSTDVVAAGTIQNNVQKLATLEPVHIPYLLDGMVILLDDSKAAKPIILQENRKPEAISLAEMDSPDRFWRDVFVYGIEADIGAQAGFWQTAHLIAPSNVFD